MPANALWLVCRVLERLCALPLEHVSETMRPLPIDAVAGVPTPVSGVSIIRGVPVPVVDAGCLLAERKSRPTRFVTINVGARHVALAVDAVIGVRTISSDAFTDLPPLLSDTDGDAIAAIGALDAQLLVVLRRGRLVPEPVWHALEASRA